MSSTEEEDNSSDNSDFDMTDSSNSSSDMESGAVETSQPGEGMSEDDDNEEEDKESEEEREDDELVKAIKAAKEKKKVHPPDIKFEDLINDISLHPSKDIIAAASLSGDVFIYKYSNEGNKLMETLELHTKACRDVEFNEDGTILYSCGKDKCIMITDAETGKLRKFYEKAHEDPLYRLHVFNENLFCTGDENGVVKVWDIRQNDPIITWKKMEDFVSDIISNDEKKYLVCSSGDGTITAFDMNRREMLIQSEEYESEFNSLALFRYDTKLVAAASDGQMYHFNWGQFDSHADAYKGRKVCINQILALTETIMAIAYDDGSIRAASMHPNRFLGNIGEHQFSVDSIDISHDGEFIASTSSDQIIKFWNIKYIQDMHVKVEKRVKQKDLKHNLPSSKNQNASDFFSDLV